ncbi:pantoate--beta-alanine ligase [Gluconacetobacter entanii]|uniref:Pantothenate synthetase n=1 Tax=Gluconacetobacter entanii TaxID=108528 RepID=A0ABT3K606_9PROT|nr:pantoate--beta-alanine ligase [Gluconacetobacter entanii]MCW4581532.1 pantoate--beta-alanine ligase [Gluconacetobacter entanii]MCW4584912.1 pantoate--beta-alanine ligase [Gluconacetobacter entanii]MCW4588325.1 pantoate--beta-alanine ligase [Gluconacetobacter entanii]MCW4590864.1 pantoate--beta-alanine ligase [Gluconacetobacter entanii]MCW4593310.1 pantoate--beta-alanine ligase [Gluconacetobacter entanii]
MTTAHMTTAHTVHDLRAQVTQWKRDGLRVGMVPTMGALHDGHLSLVRAARAACDRVVVSVFVNPIQFDDAADLAAYPRTLDADAALLRTAGVDVLYAPSAAEMYPPGFATTICVRGVSEGLCGGARPGHFDGVATVVCKLLMQALADRAFFGEKDFQQVHVVRRMVADLNLPVEIVTCPTRREDDGLAMSSRNRRLSAEGRARARILPQVLTQCAERIAAGDDLAAALQQARDALLAAGFTSVDYLELRDARDLAPVTATPTAPARLLAAAWLDSVRLIDGVDVGV